jgi:peptidoglycan/LPS O-acetylase OafA/YrhL
LSFSFYLNHWVGLFVINGLYKRLPLNFGVCAAIGFLIALSLSIVHFKTIDTAIARNRKQFFTNPRGIASCALGFSLVVVGVAFGFLVSDAGFSR